MDLWGRSPPVGRTTTTVRAKGFGCLGFKGASVSRGPRADSDVVTDTRDGAGGGAGGETSRRPVTVGRGPRYPKGEGTT